MPCCAVDGIDGLLALQWGRRILLITGRAWLSPGSEQVWPFASLPRTEAGGGDVDDFWALALPLPSLSVGVPGCGALPAEDYA